MNNSVKKIVPHTKGKPRTTNKLTDDQTMMLIDDYAEGGYTQRDLAKKYQINVTTVKRILSGDFTMMSEKDTVIKRKIDPDMIDHIWKLSREGLTHKQIAERTDTALNSIKHWIKIAKQQQAEKK